MPKANYKLQLEIEYKYTICKIKINSSVAERVMVVAFRKWPEEWHSPPPPGPLLTCAGGSSWIQEEMHRPLGHVICSRIMQWQYNSCKIQAESLLPTPDQSHRKPPEPAYFDTTLFLQLSPLPPVFYYSVTTDATPIRIFCVPNANCQKAFSLASDPWSLSSFWFSTICDCKKSVFIWEEDSSPNSAIANLTKNAFTYLR